MNKIIKIAVDAMGGDGSPKKVIDGIIHHFKNNKNSFYQIFGDKDKILPHINSDLFNTSFEIIHTVDIVKGTDSPLEGAKRGKNTSMWLAIQSVKEKKSDVVISAGNTGALLVISKLNLKMIENIDKPALSALWPNKKGMSVVLDLGANIECSPKNLIDFSIMGSSLFRSLYPQDNAKVALLNIGSEEFKGNEIIKETYQILNLHFDFEVTPGEELVNNSVVEPEKIVILGGGVSAITAAFQLTNQPGWQNNYDITLYQMGWKIGGKGASGRNPDYGERIEEHGLHLWFGFYDNAFNSMKQAYDELNRPVGSPLATWQDAFFC